MLTAETVEHLIDLSQGPRPNASPTTIDFESITAPSGFLATAPLSGPFEGAVFGGLNGNGGAVLHENSRFGVDARSGVNFLAFNRAVSYLPPHGIAVPPHIVTFGAGHTQVTAHIATGYEPGTPLAIVGFGPGGVQDAMFVTVQRTWQAYTVTGSNLAGIVIIGDDSAFVVDDIVAQ